MECYGGYNNDINVLKKSSSGGIFYELATDVLKKNGIVFGAAFKTDGTVYLKGVKTINELDECLGSKYVQAKTNDIYKSVENALKRQIKVLFCGTPCQCNALNRYLNGKYSSNLLIVDFVCHGVPSEKIWKKYLNYLEADVECCDISFRDKKDGWDNYGIKIKKKNGEIYFEHHGKDKYFKLFINDLILRPSCYSCQAKGQQRTSDITLGDLWGNELNPNGSSLIIVNSKNGNLALNAISDRIHLNKISYKLEKSNRSYYKSCTLPYRRASVFKALKKDGEIFFDRIEEYTKISTAERALCKLQRKVESKLSGTRQSYLDKECKKNCCGCGACVNACSLGAISMIPDEEGFEYPQIDRKKCCSCGQCKKACFCQSV